MKKIFPFVLLVFTFACSKSNQPAETPEFIMKKIGEMAKKDDKSCSVHRYVSKGKYVYLISPGCCDQFVDLYDSECNYICSPSGGFSGAGAGNCHDLQLTEETLIWKAP